MGRMDEWDPDWVGDPKISTLKKMAFQAEKDIALLQTTYAEESARRVAGDMNNSTEIAELKHLVARIRKENTISNLYFQGFISREEAKRLWDLYKSPDEENHNVADIAIEQLTNKQYDG